MLHVLERRVPSASNSKFTPATSQRPTDQISAVDLTTTRLIPVALIRF